MINKTIDDMYDILLGRETLYEINKKKLRSLIETGEKIKIVRSMAEKVMRYDELTKYRMDMLEGKIIMLNCFLAAFFVMSEKLKKEKFTIAEIIKHIRLSKKSLFESVDMIREIEKLTLLAVTEEYIVPSK